MSNYTRENVKLARQIIEDPQTTWSTVFEPVYGAVVSQDFLPAYKKATRSYASALQFVLLFKYFDHFGLSKFAKGEYTLSEAEQYWLNILGQVPDFKTPFGTYRFVLYYPGGSNFYTVLNARPVMGVSVTNTDYEPPFATVVGLPEEFNLPSFIETFEDDNGIIEGAILTYTTYPSGAKLPTGVQFSNNGYREKYLSEYRKSDYHPVSGIETGQLDILEGGFGLYSPKDIDYIFTTKVVNSEDFNVDVIHRRVEHTQESVVKALKSLSKSM